MQPLLPGTPARDSAWTVWPGLKLERHAPAPQSVSASYLIEPVLIRPDEGRLPVGLGPTRAAADTLLIAFGPMPALRWEEPVGLLLVQLRLPQLCPLLDREWDAWPALEERPLAHADAQLLQLLRIAEVELEAGCPAGALYADGLMHAMGARIQQLYAERRPQPRRATRPLPDGLLRSVLDFIQERLHGALKLEEIAAHAKMSPYHFARSFKAATGISVHQLLIRKRLDRARNLLISTDLPIAQVAMQSGFSDQSHLNLHCQKGYAMTPRELRQRVRRAPQGDGGGD
ncbi:MAG: AraC family transcriptional regulator [Xanthomonadales bacterium]|nr:AraC family transcriptional regulator [Xanthomonadales bacterium]